ncbi:MAG: nickel pincer cofactor biosynthesis protein LarC [Dehalococcoidia bacterium]|nr:nickel pincer cofactor biosynthesis protein LarC [Dehalococcoidia bacterium]
MLLGAIVDAGLPLDALTGELAKLKVEGYSLRAEKTQRADLAATKLTVDLQPSALSFPHLSDLLGAVDASDLPPADKEKASAVFQRLAEAEAQVHGVDAASVVLHELGSLDTLIDVVGAVAGLRLLGVEQLFASPLPLGRGEVEGAHGVLPLPAPATLALLAAVNAPVSEADLSGELVTPTGAALVATLARFERPAMTLDKVGCGAGSRNPAGRPNVLRLWLGEELAASRNAVLLVETNIDDMSAELLGYVQERLFAAGAADVWFTPIFMKKNRPATMLSLLCAVEREEAVVRVLLEETSTLGVRVREVRRHEAQRETFEFESSLGPACVKVKRLPGKKAQVSPEYEACRQLALERDLPLAEVYRTVEAEARSRLDPKP